MADMIKQIDVRNGAEGWPLWVIWPNSAMQRIGCSRAVRTISYPVPPWESQCKRPQGYISYQFTIGRKEWEECGGSAMLAEHAVFLVSTTIPQPEDLIRAGTGYLEVETEHTVEVRVDEGVQYSPLSEGANDGANLPYFFLLQEHDWVAFIRTDASEALVREWAYSGTPELIAYGSGEFRLGENNAWETPILAQQMVEEIAARKAKGG